MLGQLRAGTIAGHPFTVMALGPPEAAIRIALPEGGILTLACEISRMAGVRVSVRSLSEFAVTCGGYEGRLVWDPLCPWAFATLKIAPQRLPTPMGGNLGLALFVGCMAIGLEWWLRASRAQPTGRTSVVKSDGRPVPYSPEWLGIP
jgi:hypothetical protein